MKTWSPQQKAFLDWCVKGNGSCILEAVAGAGKTTTLIEASKLIKGKVAIVVYNKKNAEELKEKLTKNGIDWQKAQAGTVHSFGFAALRKAQKNIKVDGYKLSNLAEKMFETGKSDLAPYRQMICKLVSYAKQAAFGVVCSMNDDHLWFEMADHFDVFDMEVADNAVKLPETEIIKAAKDLLSASNEIVDVVDFDDMVYLPLYLKLSFWTFDVVMIDEAQDINASRRALCRALLKKGGRAIAVGDRHQAIYGFTGADNNSLDLIRKDFGAVDMPLTVSFRCPKKVVEFARQWVNHIQPTDTAKDGTVSSCSMDEFMARKDLKGESAVLCRVTKPLVELAFKLIRRKVACRVEGRDIGENIIKLIQRWKVQNLDKLEEKLDGYLTRETTKLLAKKQEVKLQQVSDMVETVKVIIDQCRSENKYRVTDAVDYVNSLFADDVKGVLTLSTIHKSKGREWTRVFWYDRAGTCPSKWARQDWQKEQEINLMYVAATRSMDELIELQKDVA